MNVEVTQYHLPNGRTKKESCEVSDALADKYAQVKQCGLRITAEVLSTGAVSTTLSSDELEVDYDIKVVNNKPGAVRESIEEMLRDFNTLDFDEFKQEAESHA